MSPFRRLPADLAGTMSEALMLQGTLCVQSVGFHWKHDVV
jgi:hypothetical protein